MVADIIVTTPKAQAVNAAKEAADCIRDGGTGYYFRRVHGFPRGLVSYLSRIFYVEAGYVRGYGVFDHARDSQSRLVCDTTKKIYEAGCFLYWKPQTWHWIKPVAMKGFQGWRYYKAPPDMEVVGDWLAPMPPVPESKNNWVIVMDATPLLNHSQKELTQRLHDLGEVDMSAWNKNNKGTM